MRPEACLTLSGLAQLFRQQFADQTMWSLRLQGPSRPPADAATGVLQRRMSNGIKVNFKQSDNEPRAAMLRIVAAGGRACEGVQLFPKSPFHLHGDMTLHHVSSDEFGVMLRRRLSLLIRMLDRCTAETYILTSRRHRTPARLPGGALET